MIFPARFFPFILICILFTGCGEKKDAPASTLAMEADSLISQENMILILSDVHVVEAAFLLERNDGKEMKGGPDAYYNGIFKKYHITRSRYDSSLAYYRQNPENYAKMYDKVIEILDNRKKQFPGID